MNLKNFYSELKRRNVYKVAITYSITAWLIAQIVALTVDTFNAPEWVTPVVFILLLVGFPIALILAWAFEMSPQGIIRTTSEDSINNPYDSHKKKPLTSNIFIGVLLVALIGQFLYFNYSNSSTSHLELLDKSIAILPFRNESANMDNQYFCNGIMEAILNHLSKIEDLRVISRTSVEQFRDNVPSTVEIGKRLNVNYILEGSVQRIGDEAIITAQLINANNEEHIWSGSYDRNIKDVFKVQAEITEIIAAELETKILPEVKERIEMPISSDPVAYDYYLQGNEFLFKANKKIQSNSEWKSNLDKAQLFFESAIKKDSVFADAYVGLAKVEYENQVFSINNSNKLDEVLILANKAILLNPDLTEAHRLKGMYYNQTNQEDLALIEFKKALLLNPNDVSSLYQKTFIYLTFDHNYLNAVKALKEIEKRINLPEDLWKYNFEMSEIFAETSDMEMQEYYLNECLSLIPDKRTYAAWLYMRQKKFNKAIDYLNHIHQKENQSKLALSGAVYLQQKDYRMAVDCYKKWESLVKIESPTTWVSTHDLHRYGQSLYLTNQKEKGVVLIKKQIEIYKKEIDQENMLSQRHLVSNFYDLAGIYSFLGNKEMAYYWLEKFEQQDGWRNHGDLVSFIKMDIQFDNIREDQQFKNIVERGSIQMKKINDEIKQYLTSI